MSESVLRVACNGDLEGPDGRALSQYTSPTAAAMAINFSASFAACLAAGIKVPRQIMYCIAQGKASLAPATRDPLCF